MNSLKMNQEILELVKEKSASFFDIYNSMAIVLIGNNMETTIRKVISEIKNGNMNSRVGIYAISEDSNNARINMEELRNMDFFKYNQNESALYGSDFLEVRDENGIIASEESYEKISNPDIKFLKFRELVSDQDKRRAAELAAAYIDASWNVVLISDNSDKFSLDMHSTLVSRIPEAFAKSASITFKSSRETTFGIKEVSEMRHIQEKSNNFVPIKATDLVTDDTKLLKPDRNDIDRKVLQEVRKILSSRPEIR
ncbi:MAG: hypothetical protein M1496_04605 [Candidatus Thermoplasmatota archaeon]|jgi:hypothetical protein|nr:hypothetical protein [Candidatus Thermoplasmatota archaeon]